MIWPILEARAEIQKHFRSFFGSNEDIQKSFWNYPTFRRGLAVIDFLFLFLFSFLQINIWTFIRLLDDTFTIEEVEDILKDIDSMVETEVETELFGAARTNVLLLQQIFLQVKNFI